MNPPPTTEAETPPGLTPPTERRKSDRRLGDIVVDLGYTTREAVEVAVTKGREIGQPVGRVLIEKGTVTPNQLAHALAERFGLDHVDLNAFPVDMGAVGLVSPDMVRRHHALPVAFIDEHTLLVAMADPANVLAMDDFKMSTGLDLRRAVASLEDILAMAGRSSDLASAVGEAVDEEEEEAALEMRESADDAPVVKLVHSVIADAVERGASDIHFDPRKGEMKVRFRVDGVVSDATTVPKKLTRGLVSRVKIMADLDISERRMPQDGRVGLNVSGRQVDLRVVTLPIVGGESIVIRILDKEGGVLELEKLGMQEADRQKYERALHQTHGAVLVTGPTGSGKSTSLYAGLEILNKPDRTLITIEDPVEYEVSGVKQIQVNPKTGLTFAKGLRAMMRADPDVVLVGEIRDRETAQIAIEASLTGHLVLSTLHTNDAPTSIVRLIEMGIEPFLVASGVDCVIAQRLVRTLCECKTPVKLTVSALKESGLPAEEDVDGFEPNGCVRCGQTGYKGRLGVYEVMPVSKSMRELILESRPADEIAAWAEKEGMTRLIDDGFQKIKDGHTSVDEVLRVLGRGD
jgi:type IV pilus assembly protein PilB